jgi:hypothetical protein
VLKALQGLRAISLHPRPNEPAPDETFIAASARLQSTFEALDRIADAGERALIFLVRIGARNAPSASLRLDRRHGFWALPSR